MPDSEIISQPDGSGFLNSSNLFLYSSVGFPFIEFNLFFYFYFYLPITWNFDILEIRVI